MSFNSNNKYKGRNQRIDTELNDILKNNAMKTGMSIPRISNDLANYLRTVGWEISPGQIRVVNPKATQRLNMNDRYKKGKKYA